jgi:hypothetical protein
MRAFSTTGEGDMKPRVFATESEFSAWLERNHDRARELWVGYYGDSPATLRMRPYVVAVRYKAGRS